MITVTSPIYTSPKNANYKKIVSLEICRGFLLQGIIKCWSEQEERLLLFLHLIIIPSFRCSSIKFKTFWLHYQIIPTIYTLYLLDLPHNKIYFCTYSAGHWQAAFSTSPRWFIELMTLNFCCFIETNTSPLT